MGEQRQRIQRVVVKVGSSVLTDARGRLQPSRVEQLAGQVASCAAERRVLLVSSGAIACGMARLGLTRRPEALAQLQACAAIGQSELMHHYNTAFNRLGMVTAQVLLTQEDLSERRRHRNAKQTLLTLLHQRVVPIVNENDTVAVEEITFGDNDRLAALVACAVDAQLLILLSDVNGLLKDGKVIERVEGLNHVQQHVASPAAARQTTKGGMVSKLEAARIAGHSGIPMVIANGTIPNILTQVLGGASVGTLFVPPRTRLTPRQSWIAFALRQPQGTIVVDEGAAAALVEGGKSLLASGVVSVRGRFDVQACVAVTDRAGLELARGISSFSSSELARIRGLKSAEAAKALGSPSAKVREVIHRDHLVLARVLRHD